MCRATARRFAEHKKKEIHNNNNDTFLSKREICFLVCYENVLQFTGERRKKMIVCARTPPAQYVCETKSVHVKIFFLLLFFFFLLKDSFNDEYIMEKRFYGFLDHLRIFPSPPPFQELINTMIIMAFLFEAYLFIGIKKKWHCFDVCI